MLRVWNCAGLGVRKENCECYSQGAAQFLLKGLNEVAAVAFERDLMEEGLITRTHRCEKLLVSSV